MIITVITWQSHDQDMILTWSEHGHHMITTWSYWQGSHDCHVVITWLSCCDHMIFMLWSHDHHAHTWHVTWLSYFPHLIWLQVSAEVKENSPNKLLGGWQAQHMSSEELCSVCSSTVSQGINKEERSVRSRVLLCDWWLEEKEDDRGMSNDSLSLPENDNYNCVRALWKDNSVVYCINLHFQYTAGNDCNYNDSNAKKRRSKHRNIAQYLWR